MTTTRRPDLVLLSVTLMLVIIGLAMVYSTSAVLAHDRYADSLYLFKRQIGWAAIGVLAMVAAWYVPYRNQKRLVLPIIGLTFIALIVVLVPGIGREVGGARRWLVLGPVSLQPSEFAKYGLIVYSAYILAKGYDAWPRSPVRYGGQLLLLGLNCGLIFVQPDLGTAVVLAIVIGLQLIVVGLPWRYLGYSLVAVIPGLILGVMYAPYRLRRLMTFLHPWDDPQGGGYQAIQSLTALGHGGLVGTGLGRSQQKLYYLPEAHTDFIFAVIGEELGFIGAVGLVLLFMILLWRILQIGLRCPEPFGTLLGLGVFFMLAVQIMMNLGVVSGLLPTKGLPLPFISLGGSNLVVSLIAVGTMLNVSQGGPSRLQQSQRART